MFKKTVLFTCLLFLALACSSISNADAQTATWTNPTQWTDNTAISGTLTTRVYNNSVLACTAGSSVTSCTVTVACGSGVRTFTATSESSASPGNVSALSAGVNYTAPACPPLVPKSPTIIQIN